MMTMILLLSACSAQSMAPADYRTLDARELRVSARNCRQETGLARVEVVLDAAGRPSASRLLESSGCKDFDDAVVSQIRIWKFEGPAAPMPRGSQSRLVVPVTFNREEDA